MNATANAVPNRKMSLYEELFGPDPVADDDHVHSTEEIGAEELDIEEIIADAGKAKAGANRTKEKRPAGKSLTRWKFGRYAIFLASSLIIGLLVGLIVIVGDIYLGNRLSKLGQQLQTTSTEIINKVDGVGGQVTGVSTQVTAVSAQLTDTKAEIMVELKKNAHTQEEIARLQAEIRQKNRRIFVLGRENSAAVEEAGRIKKELESLKISDE